MRATSFIGGSVWPAALLATVGGLWLAGGPTPAAELPPLQREFRAAWIATVANIDWPSKPGLPADVQRKELIRLLDRAVDTRLNAVILQIRPAADALYASPLEPWSEYLSGTMGEPPAPAYDPLEFALAEAHARGLELHVWFNPYRVRMTGAKGLPAATHASVALPELVRRYGGFLWFDPGEPVAADRFLEVVRDVVSRYDVDGVHIDDYFYPYPVAEEGKPVPFPDDESHARAVAAGGIVDRSAWRRDNVDRLVERLWREVKEQKPHVLVGVSPFGIWRPGHPPGIKGLDQVAALNADPRRWLHEGWLDYLAPQLYWRLDSEGQPYEKLLRWWVSENPLGRGVWPGNYTSRVRRDSAATPTATIWEAAEILEQVATTRAVGGAEGNIHFSMKALADDDDGVATKLAAGPYAEPAVVPAIRPATGPLPSRPTLELAGERLAFALPEGESAWLWVIRRRSDDRWQTAILPGSSTDYSRATGVEEVAVSVVGRDGREGPAARLEVTEP